MTNTTRQQGSATAIVIAVLTVALIGALGWIFWQNFTNKDDSTQSTVQKSSQTSKVEKADTAREQEATEAVESKYVDLRTNGDTTGYEIANTEDAASLEGASQKLKDYFAQDAGSTQEFPATGSFTKVYKVDRVYGDYAVGDYTWSGAYVMWGPAGGSGAIDRISGTQSMGFNCGELRAAKVPAELVDGKCFDIDVNGSELLDYSL